MELSDEEDQEMKMKKFKIKSIKCKTEKPILSFQSEEEYEDELAKKTAARKLSPWSRSPSRSISRSRSPSAEYGRSRRSPDEYEKFLVQQQGNSPMSKKGKKAIRAQLQLENYMKEKYKKGKQRELSQEPRMEKKDRSLTPDHGDPKGSKKKGKKDQKKKHKDSEKDYLSNSDSEVYSRGDKNSPTKKYDPPLDNRNQRSSRRDDYEQQRVSPKEYGDSRSKQYKSQDRRGPSPPVKERRRTPSPDPGMKMPESYSRKEYSPPESQR